MLVTMSFSHVYPESHADVGFRRNVHESHVRLFVPRFLPSDLFTFLCKIEQLEPNIGFSYVQLKTAKLFVLFFFMYYIIKSSVDEDMKCQIVPLRDLAAVTQLRSK